jgi:predicted amidohydrolase
MNKSMPTSKASKSFKDSSLAGLLGRLAYTMGWLRNMSIPKTCLALMVGLAPPTVLADATESSPKGQIVAATPAKMCLRVAGAQIPVSSDPRKNVVSLSRAIEFARRENADMLVTPEGSLSGYSDKFDVGATKLALDEVTAKARSAKIALVLGTCFADADGTRYDAQRFYNQDGEYLGFHAKILLCKRMSKPSAKGEIDSFKSAPLRVFNLKGITVGGLVCNDMWANPEWTPMPDPYLARQLAGLGARIIFVSANAGQDDGEDWPINHAFHESNLRLRARSAGVWIVVVDAADPHGRKPSNCPSGVVGPDGHWAAQVPSTGEQFFAYTIQVQ